VVRDPDIRLTALSFLETFRRNPLLNDGGKNQDWAGALCSLPLFTTTRVFYFPVPADARNYLATAGATCALTSLIILLADWLLYGCPDPNALALWRTLDALTPGKTTWPAETGILTFGTGPLLVTTLDMWLSGLGAARWYAREAP
jgi:hypothetical protein